MSFIDGTMSHGDIANIVTVREAKMIEEVAFGY
jgi:hypothetical protein